MKTNSFHFKFILSAMLLLLGMSNFAKAADELLYDELPYGDVKGSSAQYGSLLYGSGVVGGAGTEYTVLVQDADPGLKFIEDQSYILNTSSVGRLASLSVVWGSTDGTIRVYGKNTPFSGIGDKSSGTLIASISCPETSIPEVVGAYSYILIEGISEPVISSLKIGWKKVVRYNISCSLSGGKGSITAPTEAERGQNVTVTFKGGEDVLIPGVLFNYYELQSYTIGGQLYTLTEAEYTTSKTVTFKMPSENVIITGSFASQPNRVSNKVSVESQYLEGRTITLVSGSSCTINFVADYALQGQGTHGTYQGGVSVAVGDRTISTSSDSQYSPATGRGSVRLYAYNQGTTTLTFHTVQSNDYKATDVTYTIKVIPREVMLVAEYNGKCYALANDMSNGKLGSQEGLMVNGVACLFKGGYRETELKWKVCTKSDGTFTIQNMDNKYLFYDSFKPATLTLTNTASAWGSYTYSDLDAECYYHAGNAIVYYAPDNLFSNYSYDKYQNGDYSRGAFETSSYSFIDKPEEEVTIRTDLTPDKIAIVCLPYSFIAADGLKVYNLDNKVVNTETTDFYICSLDEGELTEAGRPYIIKSASAKAKVYKVGNESATTAGHHRGLYGTLEDMPWSGVWGSNGYTLGNVLVVNAAGEIKYANGSNGNGGVHANRGYMLLNEILPYSDCGGVDPVTNAPRRESLSMEGERVPTALNPAKTADEIDWNQPVYNILGQRVDRSATGVLIQNGVKIFVQ